MPLSGVVVTSNIDVWRKAGFAAANYLSSRKLVVDIGRVLADRYRAVLAEQFKRQGSFGRSGRWQSLSERYAARKKALFPGAKILEARGDLKASWTTENNNIARATANANGILFRFGSEDKKAAWHQKGSATNNLPARRQLDFTDQQLRGSALAIARTMEQGLFSRVFFERQGRNLRIAARFTGWEQVELP
jgi:phage gpG-like protein